MGRWIALCLALVACGDDGGGDGGGGSEESLPSLEEGCQPLLAGHHCTLPYPSDFFLQEDSALPSGKRLVIEGAAEPLTENDVVADFSELHDIDGFSRLPMVVATLEDTVVADGFVGINDDLADSTLASSQSLLIDTVTGELVPHFTDVDPRAFDPKKRAIVMHPVAALEPQRRYVALLQGVKNEEGALVEAALGFDLLRRGKGAGEEALASLQGHYDEQVLPLIEAAGVDLESVQLAWDFTTGSDEQTGRDLLRMRETTRQWIGDNGITVVVDEVIEDPEGAPELWRQLVARITVPLFMDSDEPGALLTRDDTGAVQLNGTAEVDLLIHVPVSVRDGDGPGQGVMYGHGFFGGREELETERTLQLSDELGTVMVAIDWWGMSERDLPALITDLTADPIQAAEFHERVQQAMVNWMVVAEAMDELAALPELQRPDTGPGSGDGALAGQPLMHLDGGRSFLGISLGHILGGVATAILPNLQRSALQVGGAGLTHLMFRAKPFEPLLQFISTHFKRPINQYVWAAMAQSVLDEIDPGFWARFVFDEPLEGASQRQLLLQMGVADLAVPNFGTLYHARSLGLEAVSSEGLGLFGFADVGQASSGFSLYDYGEDAAIYEEPVIPTSSNDVHEDVRITGAALEQIRRFLEPQGQVEATCSGACDPE